MQDRDVVLVGVGIVDQRCNDPLDAKEPLALMVDAARQAGDEAMGVLGEVGLVSVPTGRWGYANPGRLIADRIGLTDAHTIAAVPGVSQQTVISGAVDAVADGRVDGALVVGGEAGWRIRSAQRAGVELTDTVSTEPDDEVLRPSDDLFTDAERAHLGYMPVGYYALIDSAWRHACGTAVNDHVARIADQYASFSRIAADNPHGWHRDAVSADAVREAHPMAFPYTRLHVSDWNVDQASALLFCSTDVARRHGVPEEQWIHPQAFAEANHMTAVSQRGDLHRCVGAELAGQAVLEAAACTADDLDLIELYSCFPSAVALLAESIGLDPYGSHSFTGAMTFAGGPLNNFVLQATAQMARRLRASPGRALVTAVSGLLTKQGYAIWGSEPNPSGRQFRDVTAATAAETTSRESGEVRGPATVIGATVLSARDQPDRAVAIVEGPTGERDVVATTAGDIVDRIRTEDMVDETINTTSDGWV